jgi:uncharacterized protein
MLTEPLPTRLDVRKAAARGVEVRGVLKPSDLARVRGILASDTGRTEAHFAFSRDEENRSIVGVSLAAQLEVICQRCLEPMPIDVSSHNELAVIGDDTRAGDLPETLEPLVVEGESCDLWSVVEDELILGLPIVSYHDTDSCKKLLEDYSTPPSVSEQAAENNPFRVLEQLKPGGKN